MGVCTMANTQEELRQRWNPDGSQLRRVQLRMLEMLKFIDQVCTDHGINYWLDSGTLLGAARHKGFIPWDDDTDICMPYEDMLKFKKVMLTQNPSSEFVLQCPETDPHIYNNWVILRDLKSEGIHQDCKMHDLYKYKGLNVDIFPLTDRYFNIFCGISNIYYKALIKAPLNGRPLFKLLAPLVPLHHRIFERVLAPIFRSISRLSPRREDYRMAYGCEFTSRRRASEIWPLTRMEFEGTFFNVPRDTDAYLTSLYGDWRQIPAADKIQTHDYTVKFFD